MSNEIITLSPGRAVYHDVWSTVRDVFYDNARLDAADWSAWEHRFDDSLTDLQSALPRIDEMLAALNDRFTVRLQVASAPSSSPTPSAPSGLNTTAALTSDAGSSAVIAHALTVNEASASDEYENNVLGVLSSDGDGYLRINDFDDPNLITKLAEATQKIASCRGYVLDLRNNRGGSMHQCFIAQNFLVIDGTLATVEIKEPGGVIRREYGVDGKSFFCRTRELDGSRTRETYERQPCPLGLKPLVVLINKSTASSAEAMAVSVIQNCIIGKVTIVGDGMTRCKGVAQSVYEFANGEVKVNITRSRWICPGGEWLGDGGQTVGEGIDPEVFVEKDTGPEGLREAISQLHKLLD